MYTTPLEYTPPDLAYHNSPSESSPAENPFTDEKPSQQHPPYHPVSPYLRKTALFPPTIHLLLTAPEGQSRKGLSPNVGVPDRDVACRFQLQVTECSVQIMSFSRAGGRRRSGSNLNAKQELPEKRSRM